MSRPAAPRPAPRPRLSRRRARAADAISHAPPGPGPVPPAVLRTLDLAVRRRVESLVPGEHRTPQVGAGIELATIRPYFPGDDVRHIDWNVTARMQEPHVRVHVGERALVTWLVLDGSPSMDFGTAERRKADVAEGVALALGHVASRRGNRLGLATFGSGEARVLRPRQGRAGLLELLAELRSSGAAALRPHGRPLAPHAAGGHALPADGPPRPRPASGPAAVPAGERAPDGQSLGTALRLLSSVARQRGVVAVVSDFRGERDWLAHLRRLRVKHGLLAIEIRDPRELELVPAGDVWLTDVETGRRIRVNTSDARLRERFATAAAAERAEVAAALREAGADHVVLETRGDWLRELARHLQRPLR